MCHHQTANLHDANSLVCAEGTIGLCAELPSRINAHERYPAVLWGSAPSCALCCENSQLASDAMPQLLLEAADPVWKMTDCRQFGVIPDCDQTIWLDNGTSCAHDLKQSTGCY